MTDTKDMPELLPCPFCGSPGVEGYREAFSCDSSFSTIECSNPSCSAMMSIEGHSPTALEIGAWNRRSGATVTALMTERDAAIARAERAERLLAEARKALEPFAKLGDTVLAEAPPEASFISIFKSIDGDWYSIEFDDFRAARAIINKEGGE